MENISTTLLLNAILRVKNLHYHATHDHSLPLESMLYIALWAYWILRIKKSSVAPYKVDMVLFIHDDYDVVVAEHPTS